PRARWRLAAQRGRDGDLRRGAPHDQPAAQVPHQPPSHRGLSRRSTGISRRRSPHLTCFPLANTELCPAPGDAKASQPGEKVARKQVTSLTRTGERCTPCPTSSV